MLLHKLQCTLLTQKNEFILQPPPPSSLLEKPLFSRKHQFIQLHVQILEQITNLKASYRKEGEKSKIKGLEVGGSRSCVVVVVAEQSCCCMLLILSLSTPLLVNGKKTQALILVFRNVPFL
ncbi:unnamed protein product [Trifolium pratense]|uniref:Uncharacterized protein n=1 Tax=Trifolium pratense TaxID=57577 RepID=A0ACB0IVC1_TRIPR|nr:unnamed protein product [Trifolium pratense]